VLLQDFHTGEKIIASRSSIFWNEYIRRWVLIASSSAAGEIWYAEGDTPTGPWVYTKRVVKLDRHLYNPSQHSFFDRDAGRLIYFEGTYTNAFLPTRDITPRYEYNQIMYRLALDNPGVFLPVPVYHVQTQNGRDSYELREFVDSNNLWPKVKAVSFFAFPPDRQLSNLISIYKNSNQDGVFFSTEAAGQALFYALPAEPEEFEQILGTWQCEMTDQVFFRKNFSITIGNNNRELTGSIKDRGYSINEISWKDKRFTISFTQLDQTYNLTGSIISGKLSGKWNAADGSNTGSWEGKCTDHVYQAVHSSSVVSLYLYTHRDGSKHFYSTDGDIEDKSYTQGKIICRVWKNPASLLILDYRAKAVNRLD
jgi:hypothetical protein